MRTLLMMLGARKCRPVVCATRPRLLAASLLEMIMPGLDMSVPADFRDTCVRSLFEELAHVMWNVPPVVAREAAEARLTELENKLRRLNTNGKDPPFNNKAKQT